MVKARTVSQLTPEQRKRLIELMVMMRPWIDASAPKPAMPSAACSISNASLYSASGARFPACIYAGSSTLFNV